MEKKRLSVAYLWWALLGPFGGHRFYLGQIGWGCFFVLTFGFFMVGWVIDLFLLPEYVRCYNRRVAFLREPEAGPGMVGPGW